MVIGDLGEVVFMDGVATLILHDEVRDAAVSALARDPYEKMEEDPYVN